jgi:hypothetical protein
MIKPKIEIGERSTFKMTYDEAVMYCFCLGNGWRLSTRDELINLGLLVLGWYQDDPWRSRSDVYSVTPVRVLKDD